MLCSRCRKNWITRTKKNGRLFLNCDQCLKYERDRRATCQRVYVGALPNHMLDARLGIERDREDIDGIPAITPAQAVPVEAQIATMSERMAAFGLVGAKGRRFQ